MRKLGISGAELLEDRLEHLRLLLYNMAQLLELLIIPEELKVSKSSLTTSGGGSGGSSSNGGITRTSTGTPAVALLSGKIEEVDTTVVRGRGSRSASCSRSRSRRVRGLGSRLLRRVVRLNQMLGNSLLTRLVAKCLAWKRIGATLHSRDTQRPDRD